MKKITLVLISLLLVFSLVLPSYAVNVVKEDVEVYGSISTVKQSSGADETAKLPVEIKAKSAILMDIETGEVLIEYNADEKLYPASVTKIMTILLVAEAIAEKKIALTDKIACSLNASKKGGSQIWLKEGEVMTVDELLRATVIGSANDAATLLGEAVAGSEPAFIDLMNSRAKELGMKNTNFENATGLDDTSKNHLTTARDIALMSKELMKHDFITDYTTVWMDSLRNGATELVNTNKLVRFYSGTTGLKTGTTAKAGCCVSATAKRDNLHLVAVVMGSANSSDRFETAKAMLNWGFSNYVLITPEIDEKALTDVKVKGGEDKTVKAVVPSVSPILLKKGEEKELKQTLTLAENVEAPVENSQTLGKVDFSLNGKIVASYNLTAEKRVEKLTLYKSLSRILCFLSSGEMS